MNKLITNVMVWFLPPLDAGGSDYAVFVLLRNVFGFVYPPPRMFLKKKKKIFRMS